MLVRSINKENKAHHKFFSKHSSKAITLSSIPSPVKRPRKSARVSALVRAEKCAVKAVERRAKTLSPPVSKVSMTPTRSTLARSAKPRSSAAATMMRDVEMMDCSPSSPSSKPALVIPPPNLAHLKLPHRLNRPPEKMVKPEVLQSIDEELPSVPIDYLKDVLTEAGAEMIQKLSAARILPPKETHRLPRELEVIVQDMTNDLPTHVLAIVPRKPPQPRQPPRISLHLTHDLVLGLHCASIPPSSFLNKATQTVEESTNLTLPVIPLSLPDPGSFPLLHYYLYTKNVSALVGSLIPLPPATIGLHSLRAPRRVSMDSNVTPPGSPTPSSSSYSVPPQPVLPLAPNPLESLIPRLPILSSTLARTFTSTALSGFAGRIHGVWANACSLGVYEEELWDTIDFCWEAVMGAMRSIAVGHSVSVTPSSQSQMYNGDTLRA